MRTVELSTYLDAPPEQVWDHVQTSRLLHYVARGMIRFVPAGAPFPERWTAGEYRTWMWLFGIIPLGWQAIGIELPPQEPGRHVVRDNGHGPLIRRWDHWIEITAEEEGTRYVDRVHIEAGLLTPLIWAFARLFYAHRQRRWRKLVAAGFRYNDT
ncbi:MAG: hypothetical protein ACK44O_05930 [Novosphingobium sp.]|jgi:ligand-binding SRPBCC domain-containing protein|uniref:hypothetical protein n=1 Tax=Novosphingobium sp. TaxID=1874826 RepID=UPI00391C1022|nr:hypothetical protein [Novosphingobium sp.]